MTDGHPAEKTCFRRVPASSLADLRMLAEAVASVPTDECLTGGQRCLVDLGEIAPKPRQQTPMHP